ncbi:Hypothetical protein D9617_18g033390 [Elsinoe fawcettii]|nr:Hypothetical protein D9617_18g033390 [Elsinoe fawcettii]
MKEKVPETVIDAARRSIAARHRCTRWFERQSLADDAHSHFVRVMSDTLALLGIEETVSKQRPELLVPKSILDPASRNAYADLSSLHIDDGPDLVSQHDRNDSAISTPQLRPIKQDEKAECQAEIMFEAHCLFQDYQEMRETVMSTWTLYKERKIDFMTASVTTDTAIDLAKQQSEEFLRDHPELDGIAGAPWLLFRDYCLAHGTNAISCDTPEDALIQKYPETADWCLISSMKVLSDFMTAKPARRIPGSFPGALPIMLSAENIQSPLVALLHQVDTIHEAKINLPTSDRFTQGVKSMLATGKLPIWLGFAVRTMSDVLEVLGSDTARVSTEMQLVGRRWQKTLRMHEAFMLQHRSENVLSRQNLGAGVNKQFREIFSAADREIRAALAMITRYIVPTSQSITQTFTKPAKRKSKSFVGALEPLYQVHPVLSGVMAFGLSLQVSSLGLRMADHYGLFRACAFLYNAIKHDVKTWDVQWPDIDALLRLHGDDRVFIGPRPTQYPQAYRHLLISQGCSTAYIPQKSKSGGPANRASQLSDFGPGKARTFSSQQSIDDIFRDRYSENKQLDLSNALMRIVHKDLITKSTTWTADLPASIPQLLTMIADSLKCNEQMLTFDYLGLDRRCDDMLRQLLHLLESRTDPAEQQFMKSVDHGVRLSGLAVDVFDYAQRSLKDYEELCKLKKPPKGYQFRSGLIGIVGIQMRLWAKEKGNGSVGLKELNVFGVQKMVVEPTYMISRPPIYKTNESLPELIGEKKINHLLTGIKMG